MDNMYSPQRYGAVAILLHWVIAVGVVVMIGLGWYMSEIPKGDPSRSYWFNLHKSIGTTIGVLVLLRLLWRATHRPPALPASMPSWEQAAAKLNHALLYICLLVMPLVGFLASNFTKYGVKYFGVQIGPFFGENQAVRDGLQEIHEVLSYVLLVLVVVHIVAALKHLLIDRDQVFQRMLPGGRRMS